MQSENLTQALIETAQKVLNQVEELKNEDIYTLTWKENQNSWSILECLEHLNLYGDYYLPEIEKSIKLNGSKNEKEFKSGILGNYFAKSMLPKGKLNRMKTFRDKNPLNAKLDKTVIDRFINQQMTLIELLNKSRQVSLNEVKIKISIARLIKLKLGDTFQFVINHHLRHLKQIESIQLKIKNS
mgnify:CR=1 FL=1